MLNSFYVAGFRRIPFPTISKIRMERFHKSSLQMSSISSPVRVRFAPSPTGSLHVGGARTALFNWLLARKTNGIFIIRVEDTDEARSTRESERSILSDLRWLGLNWDEGPDVGGPYAPYRQSERKPIYKEVAEQLVAEGKAYRCFCTEEELEQKRLAAEARGEDPKYDGTWRDAPPEKIQEMLAKGAPYTIRFRVPKGKIVSFDDVVRGRVTWNADDMLGDFIILRSSGMPVYNFCVSVDDMKMGITHVIRAEEHLSNTLRQLLLLEAMNYQPPTYAHCSLILGSDRSKLSKRHGATSVGQFSMKGFVPTAMINYLVNLGWNDGTPKEIYTPQELISAFDLNRIIKSAAVFDMAKLTWINAQHCRNMSYEEIHPIVFQQMQKDNILLDSNKTENDYEQYYEQLQQQEHHHETHTQIIDIIGHSHRPYHHNHWKEFMKYSVKIAQRDMDLTIDTVPLLNKCLQFHPFNAILEDSHVEELLFQQSENFVKIIHKIIHDYDHKQLPIGYESNFHELWNIYMKELGKQLKLKGKHLYHPVRFILSGRMSGPDIGDQLKLISLAEGIIQSDYPLVNLSKRIDFWRSFQLEEAIRVRKAYQEELKKKQEQEELIRKQQEEEQQKQQALAQAQAQTTTEVVSPLQE